MRLVECFLDEESSRLKMVEVNGKVYLITKSQAEAASDEDALKNHMKQMKETLVKSYLAANLRQPEIPLKTFMNGIEKKVISYALQIAMGNQKNAADLLGLKPTTLGEKVRRLDIHS